MVNIISSAITNAPPPNAVANLMHRRNKLHILGLHTQENLMSLFRETPDGKKRKKNTTMPARNYVIITEHAGLANQGRQEILLAQQADDDDRTEQNHPANSTRIHANGETGTKIDLPIAKNERGGVTAEENASVAAPATGTTRPYALDVVFKVEINPKDPEGTTTNYGFSIPALDA